MLPCLQKKSIKIRSIQLYHFFINSNNYSKKESTNNFRTTVPPELHARLQLSTFGNQLRGVAPSPVSRIRTSRLEHNSTMATILPTALLTLVVSSDLGQLQQTSVEIFRESSLLLDLFRHPHLSVAAPTINKWGTANAVPNLCSFGQKMANYRRCMTTVGACNQH